MVTWTQLIKETKAFQDFLKEMNITNPIIIEDFLSVIDRGVFYGLGHSKYTSLLQYNDSKEFYDNTVKAVKSELEAQGTYLGGN